MRAGRTITAAAFLALGLAFLVAGLRYPMMNADGGVAAGLFPRIIGACWVASAAMNLLAEVRARRRDAEPGYARDAIVLTALTIAFIARLAVVGTVLSIAAFTAAVLFQFNRGHRLANVAVAIGVAAAVHVIFVEVFATPLPQGVLQVTGLH